MKVISKSDLLLLVPIIGDREAFDLDDFELILDRFGDDHFCVDGQMQRVSENKEMKQIREELHKSSKENNVDDVVRCKNCEYRGNEAHCPMLFVETSEFDDGGGNMMNDYIERDNTTDDGFCHKGKRIEERIEKG